ncbi:MAG TPA: hypothetical protein VMV44_15720 [Rectinemataceae bacterium]|nr:hypothetical protein [Rectinemataceae bacterium]
MILAKRAGARTVFINLESGVSEGSLSDFDEEILGRAEDLVPLVFGPNAS